MIYIGKMYAGCFKAIINSVKRQLVSGKRNRSFTMFDMRKSFVFRGCQQLPIFHEARGGVVKRCINAQCVHVMNLKSN